MSKTSLWTYSRARLQLIKSNSHHYNWLFLPGGPGLGSESLKGLTEILDLPGNTWHVDFPGDGSNTTEDDALAFSCWSQALIEVVSALPNVVLVAHSSGGMFALATPELEAKLCGLVLMDSAPNASWQQAFNEYINEHPISDIEALQQLYINNPSNEALKKLTIASTPYFSTDHCAQQMKLLMEHLPFNYKSHLWAAKYFDDTYQAQWIPHTALIFAGEHDHITPLSLFTESREFQRENILIREIKNGSHFPWYENPEQVRAVFEEFEARLTKIL